MATNTIKTRIQHKYDTPENWAKATTFVPLKGEICIFNNGTGVKPEMKIGDGTTALASLPFLKAGGDIAVSRSLTSGTKIATITIDGVATDLYCETNTTYTAGTGITLSGTQFSLNVAGAKTALGLGSAAYTASTAYAAANHTHNYAGSGSAGGEAYQAGKLGINTEMNYGWNGLNYYNISGTAGAAAKVNDTPTTAWWHIIKLNHANTSGYYTDLAIPFNDTSIYYKRIAAGSVQNNGWVKVLDALNYTSYTVTKTGGGASGTWGINVTGSSVSCTGNAATASALSGSGNLVFTGDHLLQSVARPNCQLHFGEDRLYDHDSSGYHILWRQGDSITGAVWNDYAEYRESTTTEFGRVLIENGDDTLSPSTERLQPFAGISSDTWGFCQGETERAKTPIAVAGRVLAYPYRNRNEYHPGDCLCSAPNGTVDIMTREEVERYPDRIVGTVSCVPEYEEWGQGDRPAVKVDGRIWVKVR